MCVYASVIPGENMRGSVSHMIQFPTVAVCMYVCDSFRAMYASVVPVCMMCLMQCTVSGVRSFEEQRLDQLDAKRQAREDRSVDLTAAVERELDRARVRKSKSEREQVSARERAPE